MVIIHGDEKKYSIPRQTFVLLVAGLLMGLFLQFRPIDDVDLFWQLRTGQLMLDTGHLVEHDVFTFTHASEPVPTISWLAQLLLALLYRMGSWPLVRLGTSLAFAGAVTIAGWNARKGTGLFSLLCAVALGLLVILPHSSVRPQAFGVLGLALLLTLAQSSWKPRRQWLLAVPLLLLWQNLHPSVLMGAIALAPLVFVGCLRWWRKQGPPPYPLLVLLLLLVLSQFATPLGWDLIAWTQRNTVVSRDWLHVSEWLPPWDAAVRDAAATFWLALAVSVILLVRLRFRVALEDLALFLTLTALALTAARFAAFWAIALIPCWARWIEAAKPASLFQEGADCTIPPRLAVPLLVLGMLAVLVPLYRPGKLFSDELPLEGVRRLQAALPEGRIYNYREWAGPLIFAGFPRWQVAIDGRLYHFRREEWEQYHAAMLGEISVDKLMAAHHPDAFFLRPGFSIGAMYYANQQRLIDSLRQAPEWTEIYADDSCSVFIRKPKTNKPKSA